MEGPIFGILRSAIPHFLIVFVDNLKAEPVQGQAFKRTGIIKNCESNIAGGECTTNLDCENTHNSKICGDARCSGLNHQPRPQGAFPWLWGRGGKRPWHRPVT